MAGERRQAISTSKAPQPTASYSQAIAANGFVWVCGQVGNDPVTGKAVSDDIGEQTRQAIRNIAIILDEVGATLADIVMVHVFVDTLIDFPAFDAAYQEVMPRPFPARVTVSGGVDPFRVEIAVTAVVPRKA
ncbi:RidA family protein [Taklimakanibacter deserti]|uniref:RidA family protein n=1 Tax=Taklimakanibacter deserti TaxID=2267839 RepID=UPI000E647F41